MTENKPSLIMQAFSLHRLGGNDAVQEWYISLSDDDKETYKREMENAMGAIFSAFMPVVDAFRDAETRLAAFLRDVKEQP